MGILGGLGALCCCCWGFIVIVRTRRGFVGFAYGAGDLGGTYGGIVETIDAGIAVPAVRNVLIRYKSSALDLANCSFRFKVGAVVRTAISRPNTLIVGTGILYSVVEGTSSRSVAFRADNASISVATKTTRCGVVNVDTSRCPRLPDISNNVPIFVGRNILRRVIVRALFTITRSRGRGVIRANLGFRLGVGRLHLINISNFHLTVEARAVGCSNRRVDFVIPGGAVERLVGVVNDRASGSIRVDINGERVVFSISGCDVVDHLLRNSFLSCGTTVPGASNAAILVGAGSTVSYVREAVPIVRGDTGGPVEYLFSGSRVHISAISTLNEIISCARTGVDNGEIRVNFGSGCLLSTFGTTSASRIGVRLDNPMDPIGVLPIGSRDFLFLILPVELGNDSGSWELGRGALGEVVGATWGCRVGNWGYQGTRSGRGGGCRFCWT